ALITASGRAAFAQLTPDLDPRISRLVGEVAEDRLTAILKTLEAFGTRNTMSSIDMPGRGIGAARQGIFDEMKAYSPRLQVSYDPCMSAKQGRIPRHLEARNIMAILPGRSSRRIYVSGHYDTVAVVGGQRERSSGSQQPLTIAEPDSTAPGVNDDGSG